MKNLILAAAVLAPGGLLIVGTVLAYRYVQRRRARREVVAEMKRRGAPMPLQEIRA